MINRLRVVLSLLLLGATVVALNGSMNQEAWVELTDDDWGRVIWDRWSIGISLARNNTVCGDGTCPNLVWEIFPWSFSQPCGRPPP